MAAKNAPTRLDAQRLADLKAASKQIGPTAVSRLTWIVRFVSEEPSTWQSATRAAHGNCILALTGFYLHPRLVGGVPLPDPLPGEDVEEVHRELSRCLRELVSAPAGTEVPIPGGEVHVGLVRATAPCEKPAIWGTVHHYRSPLGVLHVLKDLVLEAGDRLVACRKCGRPLIAFKKQQFCKETSCAQQFRNQKKKEKGAR